MYVRIGLAVFGFFLWLGLHRYAWIYMGEATLVTTLIAGTGLVAYRVKSGATREDWKSCPWEVICVVLPGIFLEGLSRFMQ